MVLKCQFDALQAQYESSQSLIQALTSVIQDLRTEISALRNERKSPLTPSPMPTSLASSKAPSSKKTSSLPPTQFLSGSDTPNPTPTTISPLSTMENAPQSAKDSIWSDVVAKNIPPAYGRPRNSRTMPISRATRLLSPPQPDGTFKFVYIPRAGRVPVHEIRRCLKALDIPQSRILHICFPARNVTGLLVHSQFEPTILELLKRHSIQVHQSFNPCSGLILQDEKYTKGKSPQERDASAAEIHVARLIRIAKSVPYHMRNTVSRAFINQKWITEEDWVLATTFAEPTTSPLPTVTDIFKAPARATEDVDMTEDSIHGSEYDQ